ncbi:beta strand repeat-containing protein [Methanosphaera cuniculi]|uniref:beta strand repeat-containing protein n=1 Tax=Methanosphaera cuniculi TaxID=1077256 RepID=UPI0026DC27C3|nr:hypothetical protein [Methanosphaera cuniculi]
MIISNSTFINNKATNNGGISVNNGNSTLTINNSNFTNNTARYGGITYSYPNATITINNSNFNNNTAEMGGINYNNGKLIINNSNHTNNYAKINGGINYNGGIINITDSIFTLNVAPSGGINYNNRNITINRSNFTNNKASNSGGINANYGNLTINNSYFSDNNATTGGVNSNSKNLIIENSTFNNNIASRDGGINNNVGNLTIKNSNFTNNNATNGGINVNNGRGNITINNSKFNNNTANNTAITLNNNTGSNLNITNSNFTNNTANNKAGAIYNHGKLTIENSTFINNIDLINQTIYTSTNFNIKESNIINNYNEPIIENINTTITSPISNTKLNNTEEVTFIIENKTITAFKNTTTSQVEIDESFKTKGNKTVEIKYPSMPEVNITLNFIVKGTIANTTLPSETIKTLNNYTIVTLVNDTTGKALEGEIPVIITINDKNYTSTINSGLLNVNIPTDNLKAGVYNITINIPESEYYLPGIITEELTIEKRSIANITLPQNTIKTLMNNTIFQIIVDTDGNMIHGNLDVAAKINGVTQLHTKTDNGILNFTFKTDNFQAKNYSILIKIGENNFYNQGIITQELIIENRDSNISMITNTPTVKEQLNVNVTVIDNGYLVNNGFVIFKINGKTLKDETGKEIRVNVVNGIATLNYKLPSTIGGGKYNITCVYNSPFYNRQQTTKNFTIQKIDIQNTTIPEITTKQGENTTLNIQVNDTNANPIEGKTPICIKINGKTFIKTNITNGKINLTLPTDTFKNPEYQLLIIIGQTANYNQKQYTTTLKIISPNAKILREIE